MYYKLVNSYGEAYIKTGQSSCVIVKLPFDAQVSLTKYNNPYRKQPDDMVSESNKREFERQARQAFSEMI